MSPVFVDTFFWIALANPRDQWHAAALSAEQSLGHRPLLTTDEVLAEFLTFFSRKGPHLREAAARLVRAILVSPQVTVLPQTRDSFLAGLALYESRLDKDYSLTDCISMTVMRRELISEVLTHDDHFKQEGFTLLLSRSTP
jgi:predicted nucleic acid-binding protein